MNLGIVILLSKVDTNLKTFLENDNDNRSVFSGTSKTIQNELIDSIAFVVNKKIEDEILNSLFFHGKLMRQPTLAVIHNYPSFFVTL